MQIQLFAKFEIAKNPKICKIAGAKLQKIRKFQKMQKSEKMHFLQKKKIFFFSFFFAILKNLKKVILKNRTRDFCGNFENRGLEKGHF